MGNVLRVLGIVAASMVLGLVALFLALFTICGGLESSDSAGVLAVCLPLLASFAPPAIQARQLSGTDRQVLIGLRVVLAVYILLSVSLTAVSLASFGRYGSEVAIQLLMRNILSVLPPAVVLLAVSVRTPPAGAALDAAAGLAFASILFRFGFLAFSGLFSSLPQTPDMAFLFLRLAAFSAVEAGIAGMALQLRGRAGPWSPGALIVATLAFLGWEGLVHVAMQLLATLLY